jgi:hypothetical protein
LRSWEAAVVKPQGGDAFVLRIHEQQSVAATEVISNQDVLIVIGDGWAR